jgi:hypothetical protein
VGLAMRRNSTTPAAQARAARLAERRNQEEQLFSVAATALATIDQTAGSLELAVEMANAKIADAGEELALAVRSLMEIGYRMAHIAVVLGVDIADLRPGMTLSMRRSRGRSRTNKASAANSVDSQGVAGDEAGAAPNGRHNTPDSTVGEPQ